MSQLIASLRYDIGHARCDGDARWYLPALVVVSHLRWAWLAFVVCRVVGHDYDTYADAENGTEDGCCSRCGDTFHAQF